MDKHFKQIIPLLLVLGLLLSPSSHVIAQTNIILTIDDIDNQGFPELRAVVSVLDTQGYPIQGLATQNFSISENQQPVSNIEVTSISQHPLEIALLIDTSNSMGFG